MIATSKLHENVGSAFAAEALAYLCAIQTGIEMGLSETITEGEALSIIKKMPELCYGQIRNHCICTKYSPYYGTFSMGSNTLKIK
ncbi:hypothetical protein Goshw_015062 [Gossypium schwendimanii]|uniref:Uncharacterized protein n=1 Tax=Gossypium schwendimanii TaxID=34291 RepID=A0A7J9MMY4_GOSSC|nr:hypothetical protein [Gossypium schwendimanii]